MKPSILIGIAALVVLHLSTGCHQGTQTGIVVESASDLSLRIEPRFSHDLEIEEYYDGILYIVLTNDTDKPMTIPAHIGFFMILDGVETSPISDHFSERNERDNLAANDEFIAGFPFMLTNFGDKEFAGFVGLNAMMVLTDGEDQEFRVGLRVSPKGKAVELIYSQYVRIGDLLRSKSTITN